MSFPLLLSLLALIVSIVGLVVVSMFFKRYQSNHETIHVSFSTQLSELSKKASDLKEEIHEIRSGNYGVINRFKELVQQVDNLQTAQQNFAENLVEQDPQSRFYSKGAKLISQGASLEDVMRECDMPAAEAELLFNLHNNQK